MEDFKASPLWDNTLAIEKRLDYLLGELTIEEKLRCLTTGCPEVERLGIQVSFMGGEAAHGIEARHDQAFNAGEPEPTTSFTQPIGMSASFDRNLIRECGRAVGEEARGLFAAARDRYALKGPRGLCRWAPTVDMSRDPRWGRTEESYGEDPYLTGEMASAYIQGMKGEDPFYIRCGATLKHFYANNVETDRIKTSSSLDGRNKHEYYLEPFRKCIVEGGAEAVMTAYNEINGIPAIVNDEVQTILKDTWGLPGHVVCDGGDFQQTVNDHKYYQTHAETLAAGLKAGVDCFTDDRDVVYAAAKEALSKGLITEADVNRSVRNSFRTRIRLGFFDGSRECPFSDIPEACVNSREHRELAARMAEASTVLLKNTGNQLPLKRSQTTSLAVVGPLADQWYKDWYSGIPPYSVSVLEGIRNTYSNTDIRYADGLSDIYLTCNGQYVGLDQQGRLKLMDKEHAELFTFTDWGCGSSTLVAAGSGRFVTLEADSYIIKTGKKEAFSWFIRESWNFKEIGQDSYHLDSWNGRQVTVDPQGYLAVILTTETRPGEGNKPAPDAESHALWAGEAAVFGMETVRDGIGEAVAAAQGAERAVVVIGCNPVINSKEEIDRTTLALPPSQQQLVDRVLAVNPQTTVVLISNYPYSIVKINAQVPAILWSASGSQEMGNGIAAVLSGRVSPAGRLNMTWHQADEDLPEINDYDIIQGKRTYQYFEREVLYSFGHGLSYTQFDYTALTLQEDDRGIQVKVTITNTGSTISDEVVQLYVHKDASRVKRPLLKLQGFQRVKDVAPGEDREAEFLVTFVELCYYDVISQRMLLEDGTYTFMIGASSRDIRQQADIRVAGEAAGTRNPFDITPAECYDKYQNCFIHKGIDGLGCVIPGQPGENPNEAVPKKDSQGSVSGKDIVSGAVEYRDFYFDKATKELVLTMHAPEAGAVTIESGAGDQLLRVRQEIRKADSFTDVPVKLPEGFAQLNVSQTVKIQIEGKMRICKFWFR